MILCICIAGLISVFCSRGGQIRSVQTLEGYICTFMYAHNIIIVYNFILNGSVFCFRGGGGGRFHFLP